MATNWFSFLGGNAQSLQDSAKFSVIKAKNIRITKDEIGRGAYGVVYKAIYEGKECVAKEIHEILIEGAAASSNKVSKSFIKEVNILSTLRHPNIVHFLGVHFKEGSHMPTLIMEKMWMNLDTFLSEKSSIPLLIKVNILKDVACGLMYLHSQEPPILHRDLTAKNILLSKNMSGKLADLGIAKALGNITQQQQHQQLTSAPGNAMVMPPEALQHSPVYTDKLDIFSFGCVAVHTVTQQFPIPTDELEESTADHSKYVIVSECDRRGKYMEIMKKWPELFYLVSCCLSNDPEKRPDAKHVFSSIEDYLKNPIVKEDCSESLINDSELDKVALIGLLKNQSSKVEELESTRQLQAQELTKAKDEISCLQKTLQDQASEIDRLRSQCDKCQKDMSQQSDDEIVIALSKMLEKTNEDMKEKQEENKKLKAAVSNLENNYNGLSKDSFEKEQQSKQKENQLKIDYFKKEAEFKQNVEGLTNEKVSLIHEKESLSRQINTQLADLQSKEKEVEELKRKLQIADLNNKTQKDTTQSAYKSTQSQSIDSELNKNPANEAVGDDEYREHIDQKNMLVDMQKVQKENEKLKYKLKQAEEMQQKLEKDLKEKVEEEMETKEAMTNKDLARKLEAEEKQLQQEKEKIKHQLLLANKLSNEYLTEFNENVKEMQIANESIVRQENQLRECLVTIKKQVEENSQLKLQFSYSRKQMEEKLLRLSLLQPQLHAYQETLEVKDEELNGLRSQNKNLQKLYATVQRQLEDLKTAQRMEVKIPNEKQPDVDIPQQVDLQELIKEKEKEIFMLNQKYHETNSQLQERSSDLEKQINALNSSHRMSRRQLENMLKEKSKHIEALEKKAFCGCYWYSLHWSPYLSLPVKRIKPSAAVVKDKVFVTGGYQENSPQGEDLDLYVKHLEKGDQVFCFHTGKCKRDSIAVPVVLGGVASVNGQCVLVSGAEGNILTGNVYVLCEEGSNEQWKKFSEPVPTPRILPCVCCYGDRWLIVCGGYACKEGSNLLEAVKVVEILDSNKGEWFTLPLAGSPSLSTILACSIVGDDVYITGDDKVLGISCSKLVSAISAGTLDSIAWSVLPIEVDNLYPFSIVDVNGEPIIIASISGSEDDVTSVLMKDTTDTWRKMSEAVECQHCSAVVVTPTLELLLFGGSGNVQLVGGTDTCQNGTLVPIGNTNIWDNKDEKTASKSSPFHIQENMLTDTLITQPPAVSFIGPIHTKQFDHKGGTFQSPVHKVSIVVPPNAIDDGEKVTVHMGATTSGPFDLPEDCKLRSAVVWLGSGSDVVLKRSIAVVVPHSVFTSPQHHSMIRFLTCEDYEGPRYKLQPGQDKFEIAAGYGLIRLQSLAMVAIVSQSESILVNEGNVDKKSVDVPVCYVATLFWPPKSLPVSFRADVFCVQNIPSELYKVDILCKKAYYKENRVLPEVVGIKLIVYDDKLKCVLPCISDDSNECNCFTGWDVTPLTDITEAEENIRHHKINSLKFAFKFNCCKPGALLSCCFEFQGANREGVQNMLENVPKCLKSKFFKLGIFPPVLLQSGVNREIESFNSPVVRHDQEKLKEQP